MLIAYVKNWTAIALLTVILKHLNQTILHYDISGDKKQSFLVFFLRFLRFFSRMRESLNPSLIFVSVQYVMALLSSCRQ